VATANLIGVFQLLLPAFAFFNDMRPHCLGFRYNPLVPGVVFLGALFWGIWDIIGKGVVARIMGLETLPTQFRLRLLAFAVATFTVIKVLLIVTRWATLTHRINAAQLRLIQWRVVLRRLTAGSLMHVLEDAVRSAMQRTWQGVKGLWRKAEAPHAAPGLEPLELGATLQHESSLRERFSLQ